MKKRLTLFLASLFLFMGEALAQTQVNGTVLSQEDGEPIAVPTDLAIVTLGQGADETMPYIDNGMRHHAALALQVLESRLRGQRTPQRLYTFQPELKLPEVSP